MNILVFTKRVVDYTVRVRPHANGRAVDTQSLKHSMNPFDEIAVEAALQLVEAGHAQSVRVVAIGSNAVHDILRQALAMGAQRAIQVVTDDSIPIEPMTVAEILRALALREPTDLVLLGKQAIDDDANETGQMTAALLDWPQATFASTLAVTPEGLEVTREVDGGLETLAMALPAVVTTDLRLNTPRYVRLPALMQAKRKPLETLTPAELGVELRQRLEVLAVKEPPRRQAGVKVTDLDAFIDHLRQQELLP